jgi:hypothetical protein
MEVLTRLEKELKETCIFYPHWQQLMIQGFWYGLLSWCISCLEDGKNPKDIPYSVGELLKHADAELLSWPYEWLNSSATEFLQLNLSLEQLNVWFERLDIIFRDCIPTDLDIFSTLATGEHISDTQWERLYDAVAFLPPNPQAQKKRTTQNKTQRVRGRRAITPMKHRKAMTHHNRHHQPPINIVKLK